MIMNKLSLTGSLQRIRKLALEPAPEKRSVKLAPNNNNNNLLRLQLVDLKI